MSSLMITEADFRYHAAQCTLNCSSIPASYDLKAKILIVGAIHAEARINYGTMS